MKTTNVIYISILIAMIAIGKLSAQNQAGTETGPWPASEMYVVLNDKAFAKTIQPGAKLSKINESEISLALKIFDQAITNHNNNEIVKAVAAEMLAIIDAAVYYKQLIPFKVGKEKFVYFNCLCSPQGDVWKEKIIMYDGGWKCYFHVIVNLTKNESSGVRMNGIL